MGSDNVFYSDSDSDSVKLDELITFSIGEDFTDDRSACSNWDPDNDVDIWQTNNTIIFRPHEYSTDSESETSNWMSDIDDDDYFFRLNGSAIFHKKNDMDEKSESEESDLDLYHETEELH